MSSLSKSEDNKKFAVQTLSMLNPILSKKQFQLVNLELKHKTGKILDDLFSEQKRVLNKDIINLKQRILREIMILESADPRKQ